MKSLKVLDMSGCRGDETQLESAVWKAIQRTPLPPVAATAKERAEAEARSEQAAALCAEAEKLRVAAKELLDKARELEEAARKLLGE